MKTIADVQAAFRRRATRTNTAEANRVIERIAGTCRIESVDPDLYPRIIEELERDAPSSGEAQELDPAAIYAHWNSFRRAPRDGESS